MSLRSIAARALFGTSGKKSRFHTYRGQLLPLKEWPAASGAFVRRLRGMAFDRPWLAPQAVSFLDRLIKPDWIVAELGAGASTTWLGQRAGRVVSFEHDCAWASKVETDLLANNLTNVEVHLVELRQFDDRLAQAFAGCSIDLLLIDQMERQPGERVTSVRRASQLLRPGGYLVFDDSDRPSNAAAFHILAAWPHRRFVGVRPFPFQATETTVFQRPPL